MTDNRSGLIVLAVLTPESQRLLLERVPPRHPDVKAHHMTIAYDPPVERFLHYYRQAVGQIMPVKVIGIAEDDHGQAVRVEAESENENPHITISCADGVPSVYSNELLSKGWKRLSNFYLQATVETEALDEMSG